MMAEALDWTLPTKPSAPAAALQSETRRDPHAWASQGAVWHPDSPGVGLYSTAAATSQAETSAVETAVERMVAAREEARKTAAAAATGGYNTLPGGKPTNQHPLSDALGGYFNLDEAAHIGGAADDDDNPVDALDGETFDQYVARRVFKSTTHKNGLWSSGVSHIRHWR
eukprot:SAG31_NODE_453_length_15464_cov_37.074064_3_plen_169_part_00